jgi:uncharacterized membrane protein
MVWSYRIMVVLMVLAATVAGSSSASALSQPDPEQPVDPDSVRIAVYVSGTGDAHWTVEYRYALETDDEAATFDDLAGRATTDESQNRARFVRNINNSVSIAAEATGRRMGLEDVDVETERGNFQQSIGIIRYEFTWRRFAATEESGETLVVGDAIDQFYVDENTTLQVSWPKTHRLEGVTPTPTDVRSRSVTYTGPISFASGEPRIRLTDQSATNASEATSLAAKLSTVFTGLAAVFLFLSIAAAAHVRYRGRGSSIPAGLRPDIGWTDGGQPAGGPDSTAVTASGGGSTPATTSVAEEQPLLSKEEQLLRALDRHGGRVKQQQLVAELGWSDSKTSKVVSTLRESGQIETFRLGQENVVDKTADTEGTA